MYQKYTSKIKFFVTFLLITSIANYSTAQNSKETTSSTIEGIIVDQYGKPVEFADIFIQAGNCVTQSNENGNFTLKCELTKFPATATVQLLGFEILQYKIEKPGTYKDLRFTMTPNQNITPDIVVSGTMKEVNRVDSPVPVEVFNPGFFKRNPTPNLFEGMQNINGVRPQLNCSVCNTGDIRINGLAGPYTMVLIDGMPIVSSLATVYGLFGIPNSLVERIEIVKGPASSLYGSEAIGGLINVITKKTSSAPLFSLDLMSTSWAETNLDLGIKSRIGKNIDILTGLNLFWFGRVVDDNQDGFTDMTLQKRGSIFQKWNFQRKDQKLFSIAARLFIEDRWGGENNFTPEFKGTDIVYGEQINTKRWELLGNYELPLQEKFIYQFSLNGHHQNSFYGTEAYNADQRIFFNQLLWDKKIKNHDLLGGIALRYTYYDDNTPATGGTETTGGINAPEHTWLPGIFIQDEISFNQKHKLLIGARYDYNSNHGNIFTPRMAYKFSPNAGNIFRFNFGTGFRVVNLFTEDHAALTGARTVIIEDNLNPERSYNFNLNYLKKIFLEDGHVINVDISAWYTYFDNRIIPDYDTNPNQIIYANLDGYGISRGVSANADFEIFHGLKAMVGASILDVFVEDQGEKIQQILTERYTGTWSLAYTPPNAKWTIDYTGNLYSPMRIPLAGDLDPRPEFSPWWSIQNIQFTYRNLGKLELYGGIKNLLNWRPTNGIPFLISRTQDPFDKQVSLDNQGNILPTPDNPYALSFDPNYSFAPNQGLRVFLGVRYSFR